MIKTIVHYLDQQQFIVSIETDPRSRGGNSLQHSMMFNMLGYLITNSNDAYVQGAKRTMQTWKIASRFGEPRLHWDNKTWPGQSGHMSRDNLFCAILALRLFNLKSSLTGILLAILFRAGFMWNTKKIGSDEKNFPDWCGPMMWFIALRCKWNPLNIVADVYLFFAILIQVHTTNNWPTRTDGHINLIFACEVSRQISDNFILNKITKYYKSTGYPKMAVNDYFDNTFSPPLHFFILPVIEKW